MQLQFIEVFLNTILLQYNYPWYERIFDQYSEIIMVFVLPIIILIFILRKKKKSYHSHWNTLIEGFQYSTQDFYELVEAELYNHEVENISTGYTNLAVAGLGSHRRMYLEVQWKDLHYYICAAPFGDGFFVSSWLQNSHSLVEVLVYKLPIIGGKLHSWFFPETIYKVDTSSMFMTFAHSSVMKAIDQITSEAGVRALSESERKPILADLFKR